MLKTDKTDKIENNYATQGGVIAGVGGVLIGAAFLGGPVGMGLGLLAGGYSGYKTGEGWDKDLEIVSKDLEIFSLEEGLRAKTSEIKFLEQRLSNSDYKITALQQELSDLIAQYQIANNEIISLKSDLKASIEKYDTLSVEIIGLNVQLVGSSKCQQLTNEEIAKLKKELADFERKSKILFSSMEQKMEQLSRDNFALKTNNSRLDQHLASLGDENFHLKISIDKLSSENATLRMAIKENDGYVLVRNNDASASATSSKPGSLIFSRSASTSTSPIITTIENWLGGESGAEVLSGNFTKP